MYDQMYHLCCTMHQKAVLEVQKLIVCLYLKTLSNKKIILYFFVSETAEWLQFHLRCLNERGTCEEHLF